MKFQFLLIILFLQVSCTVNVTNYYKDLEDIENIEPLVISDTVIKVDTVFVKDTLKITIKESRIDSSKITKIKKPKVEPIPKIDIPSENDTFFHYYVNGKISLKKHPWKNGERKIELYDLYGNQTFELTEIRHSYSVSHNFRFHENGAVSEIKESFNPGASLYMYHATMTFNSTNEPLVRIEGRTPDYSLNEKLKKDLPFFWNKKTKQWVQQEIVIEQPVPR